jgi:hypothetical protein
MADPTKILDQIQLILGRVAIKPFDAEVEYPAITAKLQELRELKLDEGLLDLIDDCAQVLLHMKPGNEGSAVAYALSEIDQWKKQNPVWFGHIR